MLDINYRSKQLLNQFFSSESVFSTRTKKFCQPYWECFARIQSFFRQLQREIFIMFLQKLCFLKNTLWWIRKCSFFNCRSYWLEVRSLSHWLWEYKNEKIDFLKNYVIFFSKWSLGNVVTILTTLKKFFVKKPKCFCANWGKKHGGR